MARRSFQPAFRLRTIITVALGSPLVACQSFTIPGASVIPGLGYSTLIDQNATLRRSLAITAVPLPADATYSPFRCTYEAYVNRTGKRESSSRPIVTIAHARDRLLARITEGTNTSTALIGNDGYLHDFNFSNFLGESRSVNRETYETTAQEEADRLSRHGQPIQVINEASIIFPHFANRRPTPGEVASVISGDAGKTWGQYVYRGLTHYRGSQVAVLDLVTMAGHIPVLRGFDLVDVRTMAPVLIVMDTGSRLRFERLGCA